MDGYQTPTITQAFEARDQTLPSTCSSKPSETYKPKPSAKIRDLISRLGLRFRPTNAADLAAHAGMLAMLADDLSDVPVDLLDRAIQRQVLVSPYMPKAADLIRAAKEIDSEQRAKLPPRTGRSYAHDLAALYNSQSANDNVEWYVDSTDHIRLGDISTGSLRIYQTGWQPKPGEIEEINAKVAEYAATGMTQAEFNKLVDQGKV